MNHETNFMRPIWLITHQYNTHSSTSNSQHYLHKDGWFVSPIEFFFNTGNGKVLEKCVYVGEIWLDLLIAFGKKLPIFLHHKIDFFCFVVMTIQYEP
jgi:hypothetical protein